MCNCENNFLRQTTKRHTTTKPSRRRTYIYIYIVLWNYIIIFSTLEIWPCRRVFGCWKSRNPRRPTASSSNTAIAPKHFYSNPKQSLCYVSIAYSLTFKSYYYYNDNKICVLINLCKILVLIKIQLYTEQQLKFKKWLKINSYLNFIFFVTYVFFLNINVFFIWL